MADFETQETFGVVVTGTHSAGKSTLLNDFEDGKLTALGISHAEYDDLGFGVHTDPASDVQLPCITVPESARWFAASILHRPDFLAENYSLHLQLSIDTETISRFHAASHLAAIVMPRLWQNGLLKEDSPVAKPTVLSDRGPLDGLVYSEARCDTDTTVINGSRRALFLTEWAKSYVNLVAIADHAEVPFEPDNARLADHEFRLAVARDITNSYGSVLDRSQVITLTGGCGERKAQLLRSILRAQERPATQA